MNINPLLLNLLEDAGYTITRGPDGKAWVVTHSDTGQEISNANVVTAAREALRLLRQQLAESQRELANARAQVREVNR